MIIPKIQFTTEEANAAGDEWNFNCGPGALCGLLGKRPEEIRPFMGEFESKGYTNPTLMIETLCRLGVKFQQTYRADVPAGNGDLIPTLRFGLMRVQWGGPWTNPGVPMRARYRQTHWVAGALVPCDPGEVLRIFDVNATCSGGWLDWGEWAFQLVPWLIGECVPKGDGKWWATHVLEVEP